MHLFHFFIFHGVFGAFCVLFPFCFASIFFLSSYFHIVFSAMMQILLASDMVLFEQKSVLIESNNIMMSLYLSFSVTKHLSYFSPSSDATVIYDLPRMTMTSL